MPVPSLPAELVDHILGYVGTNVGSVRSRHATVASFRSTPAIHLARVLAPRRAGGQSQEPPASRYTTVLFVARRPRQLFELQGMVWDPGLEQETDELDGEFEARVEVWLEPTS